MKKLLFIPPLFSLVFLIGCPSDTQSMLDDARFALDSCNPSTYSSSAASKDACDRAVSLSASVLAGDSSNIEAAAINASGHLGKGGIDFLRYAAKLADASGSTSDISSFIKLLVDVPVDEAELSASITPLNTAVGGKTVSTELEKRAAFQLGAIQAVQTYVLPLKKVSLIASSNTVDPATIKNIDDATAATVRTSFESSDNNLSTGGADAKTVKASRQGFCRCDLQTAVGGYTAACLRDLLRCQTLSTKPEGTEQDYDQDGICGTADLGSCKTKGDGTNDCDKLLKPTGVETCKDKNTT